MGRLPTKPKKYACFTKDEQEAYEKLNEKQRKYVDFRAQGYSKKDSYTMCGYAARNPGQAAYLMERDNKVVPELVNRLLTDKRARDLSVPESDINRQIDALARQAQAEKTLEIIEGADGETARRIQFYRDIMNGKIQTVKKTITKDADGKTKSTKIEEISDVAVRIQARKELDKILGLNMMPDIDKFQIGGITVNIVDASKKEELDDERNKIVLSDKDVEFIDGEKKLVVATEEHSPNSVTVFDQEEVAE